IGLIQRYRYGKARRRALPWAVALATALSLISLLLFFASVWVIGHWIDDAPVYAAAGLAAGCALGALGLTLTRFEDEARGLYYTPNRWLVLTEAAARLPKAAIEPIAGKGWDGFVVSFESKTPGLRSLTFCAVGANTLMGQASYPSRRKHSLESIKRVLRTLEFVD
ncbi:hypothetical protein AB4084_00665, partial [Lysobacter sp. 2RAB21]